MMFGLFPPSSSVTFFKLVEAAAFMTLLPTIVLPVKATFSILGCSAIAAPAVGPYPVTMLTTPGGTPASLRREPIRIAERGVNSEGLITTALPVASAGPIFHANIKSGKFFQREHSQNHHRL